MFLTGGQLIGEGGFGEIFDEVSDLDSPVTAVTFYDQLSEGDCRDIDKDTFDALVFKSIVEPQELTKELENNMKLHKLFDKADLERLTCLDPCKASVTGHYTYIVYRHFEGDLQNYLFGRVKSGYKEWNHDKAHQRLIEDGCGALAFIHVIVKAALEFCSPLHKSGLIHKDLKLDNFLLNGPSESSKSYKAVVCDYGMIGQIKDESRKAFRGMINFMPPFCHLGGNFRSKYLGYMEGICAGSDESEHARTSMDLKFFTDISDSYAAERATASKQDVFKLDLHPIGVIILQLVHFFGISGEGFEGYTTFAKKLMMSSVRRQGEQNDDKVGYLNAAEALASWTAWTARTARTARTQDNAKQLVVLQKSNRTVSRGATTLAVYTIKDQANDKNNRYVLLPVSSLKDVNK